MRKTHVTLFAMVRLLSGVQEEVYIAIFLGCKHLITKQTRVRLLATLTFEVHIQSRLVDSRHFATGKISEALEKTNESGGFM